MPLAFDFTSTLVIGVTLPVATTLFARSPFSTLASLVGSILVPPRVAATATITSARTAAETIEIMSQRFFFFLPLPFATAASQLGRIPFCCLLRVEIGNSSVRDRKTQTQNRPCHSIRPIREENR